jgi:type IV pilus assembly protein PilC
MPSLFASLTAANQRSLEKAALKKRIYLGSLTLFTQTLSALLEGGLPLLTALEALIDQTEDRYLKIVLKKVHEKVAGGSSFSEALKGFPKAFPTLLVSMVQAGEASGALSGMMGKVANYFDRSLKLQKRVKGALAYPIGVVCLAFFLVNALMIFVVPQFTAMFASFGAKLPLPTQILVVVSHFINTYLFYLLGGFVGGIFGLKHYFQTQSGRRVADVIMSYIPLVGELSRKLATSRFCRTYATLLASGVSVLKALEICSAASDNTYIEDACQTIAKMVTEGKLLSAAAATIPYFPSLVRHMAKAGESSGSVDTMLIKAADFYDTEIDTTIGALTSLMEPFLISFLGIVVGGIAMAIFMPVFQMSSLVSQ